MPESQRLIPAEKGREDEAVRVCRTYCKKL